MSFLNKEEIVINIKLTNIGRQLLSQGKLTFNKWAIGDSEINYDFNTRINFNSSDSKILSPKDENPKFVSYILRDSSDAASIYTSISSLVNSANKVIKPAIERGFFDVSTSQPTLLTDTLHCKQADIMIYISGLTGGSKFELKKSPSYIGNLNEPIVGDYLLVKWANPLITGGTLTPIVNQNVPYVWYKIHAKSGTLSANNLMVTVDKPSPDFDGQGGDIASGAFVYPNNNNREVSGDSILSYYSSPYVTDFIDDSVISFLENGICPTKDVPVWNMSIVYTEEVCGVIASSRNVGQYYTKMYGGFVRYIERISPEIKKIGIIHFSNSSPVNNYGEGLYDATPVLDLPTIMWHHETGGTIGLRLMTENASYILPDLETTYRNLVDKYGNIVGKVFNSLKIFVIEDQELLFAMTYKSNRNWTLPRPTLALNISPCENCSLIITSIQTTNDTGSGNGSILINTSGAIGTILFSIDNGVTYQVSSIFSNVVGGTYQVKVADTGINNCVQFDTAIVLLV